MTPSGLVTRINGIVAYLVEKGLADDQQYAFQRTAHDGMVKVTFPGADAVSAALRDWEYARIYDELRTARAFNARLADGGLIQMMYAFRDGRLEQHRLAFFPAMRLETFQAVPEVYLDDELDGDVVEKDRMLCPFRFDYDSRDERHHVVSHPKAHLTLGQYEDCRIRLSAPMPPSRFADFVIRNFYDSAAVAYADGLPPDGLAFEESIHAEERNVVHVGVPS